MELLPRAFVRPVRTDALLTAARVIAVDTSSRKSAEAVVSRSAPCARQLPRAAAQCQVAPRAILTGWVAGDALPDGLAGDECELRDPPTPARW